MIDIALFPIPNCVAFPSVTFPLHVFEPRYRTMISHCLENALPLGVCHTRKLLSPGKDGQSVAEALQSNQATYKPFDVFSAGQCELVEVLDDGRMRVDVHIEDRYRAVEEVQRLPFGISRCEVYRDSPLSDAEHEQAEIAKEKVHKRLQVMTSAAPELQQLLASSDWLEKAPGDFSFQVFKFIRMDADAQQSILESQSPLDRLNTILYALNKA